MNRKTFSKWLFLIIVLCGVSLFCGCEEFASEDDFYTYRANPAKLHDIDVLELVEMEKPKIEPAVDVNAPEADELSITLEQSRALAIANNLNLKATLIEPAIAAERVSEEEARFEAAFFSNIRYSKTDTPTSTTLTGSKVDSSNVDLGVQVPLRSGGTVTFDIADNRTKTNLSYSTLNPSYSSDLSMSVSHCLGERASELIPTRYVLPLMTCR